MSSKPRFLPFAKVIPIHTGKDAQHSFLRSIAIPSARRVDVIQTSDILYIRSENNYAHLYTISGGQFVASITLGLFEDQLSGSGFLRVHNQYLVNRQYISSFEYGTSRLTLASKQIIPVSRNRKAVLVEYLRSMMIQHP